MLLWSSGWGFGKGLRDSEIVCGCVRRLRLGSAWAARVAAAAHPALLPPVRFDNRAQGSKASAGLMQPASRSVRALGRPLMWWLDFRHCLLISTARGCAQVRRPAAQAGAGVAAQAGHRARPADSRAAGRLRTALAGPVTAGRRGRRRAGGRNRARADGEQTGGGAAGVGRPRWVASVPAAGLLGCAARAGLIGWKRRRRRRRRNRSRSRRNRSSSRSSSSSRQQQQQTARGQLEETADSRQQQQTAADSRHRGGGWWTGPVDNRFRRWRAGTRWL